VDAVDLDGNGNQHCNDGHPMDAAKTMPGKCDCSISNFNSDGNGIVDCNDNSSQDVTKTEQANGIVASKMTHGCSGNLDCKDWTWPIWMGQPQIG